MANQVTTKQSPQAKAAQTKAANKAKAAVAPPKIPAASKPAPPDNPPNGRPIEDRDLVYGNKDTDKKFPFPYGERDYYHLKTSRSMKTPSGVDMEDPGSIQHKKYNQKQWEHTNHYKHFDLMGLNVEILHDPTLKKGVQF